MIAIGEHAPDFAADSSTGRRVSLRALRGRYVVLFFFPRSFTPTCSSEVRLFREHHEEIRALGAEIVGVSTDDVGTQCRFAVAERLPFPIVSDNTRAISSRYGVLWPLVPRDKRVTMIIDGDGIVRAIFRHEFLVGLHLDDVLTYLNKARARRSPHAGPSPSL